MTKTKTMNDAPTTNRALRAWVQAIAEHTRPARIRWCDGSEAERTTLERDMALSGSFIELDPRTHPRSFLHRSDPTDVARTEHLTFISTSRQEDAGPTNHWMSREEAQTRVWSLFAGAMKDRTMYVVPYLMGPAGSPFSRVGVELTDSPYVALNLRIMTRMGRAALGHLGAAESFVRGIHSLGDLSPDRRFVVHFPETLEIWSIGSGYGGNALLSKKCHALRIASAQARAEGWLAEHMLILGLTSPEGRTHYVTAAFPSACGKTNLAMLVPSLPGWKVETVGDDICWMHPGSDGRLWAINPENGMFGVAPGTSLKTNPNAMQSLTHDVIFTNVALRAGRRVWWEGMSQLDEHEVIEDWRGAKWTKGAATSPAAHPNSRFTVPLRQCPSAAGAFDLATGVPISAILFGGRRSKLAPLVYEARSFRHGVYVGATMASETTAAATGAVGVLRNDPMAMLPFCGYNMGDYFAHWMAVGKGLSRPPKIFHVNWFRTGDDGRVLWPGFSDNIRVLKWILERVEGTAAARESAIGLLPHERGIDLTGMDLSKDALFQLLAVDSGAWLKEADGVLEFLRKFADRLPAALLTEHRSLVKRLHDSLH
ncbi:phosphoenolpyruvate carboxykinase (GTP) [Sorangium sp. So ce327]|uniref:phosphoenolpyruvate carboxykinase (GTP) n=1 Tax=Sorangium sp. So ce327 TaxID=3133301 RepID=UPI003F6040B6